jgi:hypothetical protein
MEELHNVVIRLCGCENEYQDRMYGRHKRVHNLTNGGTGKREGDAACTVCGTYHGPEAKKPKENKEVSAKTTGIARMGGKKAGKKCKKKNK